MENKYEIVIIFTDYKEDFSKECEKIEDNNNEENGYYYKLFQVIRIKEYANNIEYFCMFKREEITE